MKRLFFALWPDEPVRKALTRCALRGAGRHAQPVHCDDVHMTLQFLGNVPEERIPALEKVASELVASEFQITLTHLGCWSRPRVAWCAPDETPAALTKLVSDLGRLLADVGYPPEHRPYRAHLTLARKVRSMPETRLAAPIVWKAREFVLVESRAVAEPPRYQVLTRWALSSEKADIGE